MRRSKQRQREAHREVMRRSRERQRDGRMVCPVEVDAAMIDMLVRDGWLRDGASDRREIARAIERALRDWSPCLDRLRVKVGA